MTVQINLKRILLDKEILIKPLLSYQILPKDNLELRTRIAGQDQNNVDIELERE